jgi:hypothetical protein
MAVFQKARNRACSVEAGPFQRGGNPPYSTVLPRTSRFPLPRPRPSIFHDDPLHRVRCADDRFCSSATPHRVHHLAHALPSFMYPGRCRHGSSGCTGRCIRGVARGRAPPIPGGCSELLRTCNAAREDRGAEQTGHYPQIHVFAPAQRGFVHDILCAPGGITSASSRNAVSFFRRPASVRKSAATASGQWACPIGHWGRRSLSRKGTSVSVPAIGRRTAGRGKKRSNTGHQ